ncbi:MAG: hypothetical protein E7627_06440 [Ruminococcaceae bacterium]|nr:hypothetical protein [Oscillospiraceae bacterium]
MANLIAMSGGVDSSVSLLLSKQKFSEPLIGVTLALAAEDSPEHAADRSNISDAAAVCASQGTEHRAVYAHSKFKARVIDYFTREYLSGRTPNPCVICNREIKFGLLSDYADENGLDKIVTGHYARLDDIGGYTYIRKAADQSKDQSYMLGYLTQAQLRRAYFPLGELTKAEVRRIAEDNNLVSARRRDSQDIASYRTEIMLVPLADLRVSRRLPEITLTKAARSSASTGDISATPLASEKGLAFQWGGTFSYYQRIPSPILSCWETKIAFSKSKWPWAG